MYNSICERRMQSRGMYAVILQIPEDEYFDVYDSVSEGAATEIVQNYLSHRGDEGRPEKVTITHDPSSKIVNIHLYLYYTGNDHTDATRIPDILNTTRNNSDLA